jgi:phosphoribosyl-AMP cyclohydrolase
MALDADRVIDAVAVSQGSDFTAGHVNHSRLRHNVRRWYSRRQGHIWYLASRDIEAGNYYHVSLTNIDCQTTRR